MATPDPLGDVIPELGLVRNPQDGLYYRVNPAELELFTRTYDAPLPADEAIAEEPEQGKELADYGKLLMRGGAQIVQQVGWLTKGGMFPAGAAAEWVAKKSGRKSIGQAIEDLGADAVDYWTSSLTPAMQQELSKQFVVKNEMGEYEWGDAGFGTAVAVGVNSVPSTLLSFGIGGALTRVLQTFANPVGRRVLVEAARAGSDAAAKKLAFVDSVLGTAGFGAAEGLQAAASTGSEVERAVLKLDPAKLAENERYRQVFDSTDEDMPWAERHNYAATVVAKEAASEAGWQSGLTTALLGAPAGAYFGRLLGRRVTDTLAATAPRRIGAAAGAEAAQEFAQSGSEQFIQNRALIGVGDDRDPFEDVLNQAVGGALAGGVVGGAFGAAEGKPAEVPAASTAAAPPAAGAAPSPAGSRIPPKAQETLKEAARAAVEAGADRAQVLEVVKRAASGQAELLPSLKAIRDLGQAAAEAGVSASVSPSTAAEAPPAGPAATVSAEGTTPQGPSAAPAGAPSNAPVPGAPAEPTPAATVSVTPIAGQTSPTEAAGDVPRGTSAPAEPFPARIDGEEEESYVGRAKKWLKANIDPRPAPDPASLPRDATAYFEGGTPVPATKLITTKGTDDKGGRIALTRFQAAAQGEIPKREPIKVRDNRDGTYTVLDGNGTVNAMRTIGVADIPVKIVETAPEAKKAPKLARGAKQTSYAGQMPVETEFQLRELADLVPSHSADGTPDPRYPQQRQNRDRSRAASQVWIKETAGSFVPEKMLEGVDIGAGAPVVDADGIVDSGNGRVLLLNEVYQQGNDAGYREYLRANAAKFGLQPEEVDQFERPALVRVRDQAMTEDDVIAMTREANRPQIAALSPAEQARNDAERISDEAMTLYSPDESGNVLAASNQRFITAFLREVPAQERWLFMTADGKPNKLLADRLRAAVFDKAYGDERLLNAMAEEADPEFKNVVTALTNAAPTFARARAAGATEIIPDLVAGVDLVRKARSENMTVDQLLNQGQMFDPIPMGPARMAKFLAANMRSAKRMSTALQELAAALENQARGSQSGDMFGGRPASPQSLLDAVNASMTRRFVFGGAQAAMFSRPDRSARAELYSMVAEPGRPVLRVQVPRQKWPITWARFIGTQMGLDMDALYSRAMEAQQELADAARALAGEVQASFANPGIKKRETAEQKLTRKGTTPGRLTDIARGGFVVQSVAEGDRVVSWLADRYPVVDEGWETTPDGYADRKVAVRMRNGLVAEVQLWSEPMKAAKFSGFGGRESGEKLYTRRRALETRDPLTGVLTISDRALYDSLQADMNELYADAIEQSIAQDPAWAKVLADPAALRARAAQLRGGVGTSGNGSPPMYSRASASESSGQRSMRSPASAGTQPAPWLTRAQSVEPASQMMPTPADSTRLNDRGTLDQSTATPPGGSVARGGTPQGGPLASEAFRRWFGASQAVTADGQPQVLYHGTDDTRLETVASWRGLYVTSRPELASVFAQIAERSTFMESMSYDDDVPRRPSAQNVLPVYIRAERPLDLRSLGTAPLTAAQMQGALEAAGVADAATLVKKPTSKPQPPWWWLRESRQEWTPVLEAAGFDSVRVQEPTPQGMGEADAWFVWDPTAVKSAVGNRGTFDRANPSMLFSRSGPVDSPEFRAWFGDSKIVNEDGSPKVVYHGTREDVSEFLLAKRGAATGARSAKQAFFFSDDKVTADTYAEMGEGREVLRLREQVLDLERKARLEERLGNRKKARALYDRANEIADRADNLSMDESAEGVTSGANTMPVYLKMENPLRINENGEWDQYEEGAFFDAILRAERGGHDGVIFFNTADAADMNYAEPSTVYAVFQPTQVKSAIGNEGTFDPQNPSILMRRTPGGATGQTADAVRASLQGAIAAVEPIVFVDVVQSVAELGDRAIPGDVEGVYWPGGNRVVLVADNLRSPEHAARVFAHEVFGHLAAEQHPAFQQAIQAVYRLKGIGSREVVAAWNHVARTQPNLDRTTHAKEVIARIAEQGTDATWFRKLMDAVRQQLREWGLNLAWNDNDLRAFIRDAATDLRASALKRRYMDRHDGIARQLAALASQAKLTNETADAAPLNELYPHDAIDWILELDAELAALEATGRAPRQRERPLPPGRPFPEADDGDTPGGAIAGVGRTDEPVTDGNSGMRYGQNRFAGEVQFSRASPPDGYGVFREDDGTYTVALDGEGVIGAGYESRAEAVRFAAGHADPETGRAQRIENAETRNRLEREFSGGPVFSRAAAMDPALATIYQKVMNVPLDQLPFKDRMRAFVQRFKNTESLSVKQGLVDSFASIEELEKGRFGAVLDASQSAYKAALATKNLPSVMAAVMLRGVPEYRDGSFQPVAGRKGFVEIFKPLTVHADGNLLNHWKLWAAANRAQRLMKEGREKLFTQAEIDEALKLEQKYPFFRDVLNDWQAFNTQLLDLAEDRGIIDPEGRALWANNDYVPFYRVMEDAEGSQGPGTGGGLSGAKARIKKLTGSDEQLGDLLENMVLNTAHLIDRSFKNTAMQRIVGLADGVAMERVPMPPLPKKYGVDQVKAALAKVGINVANLTQQQLDQYVTLWQRVAPKGPDIVSVFENGRAQYYRVSDPLLLRSVAGMGFDNFADVLGLFRGSKRLLTGAITADPAFMLANFIRDTLSNWVTSAASPHPFVGAFQGFKSSITEDENLMKLMMAGGGGGGYYDSNPEDVRKLLAEKVPSNQMGAFMRTIVTPRNAWRVWRKIGAATENANRLGVFRAVLERGGSVAEAAYEARDVLNFAMRGDYAAMRWLIETVPFMNARVQGLYRLYRGARDNPKTFALKGMAIMAATMALLLRNNDREEYEELREWDKDAYWHLFIGGEHYRIPKPFEVGIIFATMPERLMRWGSGRDSHQILMKQIQAAVMDTLAFNPIPQLVKPVIEQYANRSMFTGTPIVGMAERQLKPEAQFDAWTSETARELADAMPDFAPEWLRSPLRLQAAVRAYTGAMGMYVLNAADYVTRSMGDYPEAPAGSKYDLPVFGRFVRDPNPRSTKYSDQLYKMLEEANAVHATINRYRREGQLQLAADLLEENRGKLAVRGRLNAIALQVRNVNNQIRLVQLSRSLTPEQKRDRIQELLERKNALTAQVAPMAGAF